MTKLRLPPFLFAPPLWLRLFIFNQLFHRPFTCCPSILGSQTQPSISLLNSRGPGTHRQEKDRKTKTQISERESPLPRRREPPQRDLPWHSAHKSDRILGIMPRVYFWQDYGWDWPDPHYKRFYIQRTKPIYFFRRVSLPGVISLRVIKPHLTTYTQHSPQTRL